MESEIREALEKATRLCDEECDEDAEVLILDALSKFPDHADLLTILGKIQSRLHKEQHAETTLKAVLAKNPNHEDASCALGRLLDQSLRTEEAETLYRGLLERRPDSHCALDDLCRLLIGEGRYLEALDVARDHVDRYPDSLEAYDGLRYLLAVLEDEICGGYVSESTDNETIEKLAVNLLEQFDAITRIEKNIGPLSGLGEPTASDMQEEYLRIVAELEHLSGVIEARGLDLPLSLSRQLTTVVKEGIARKEGI
jgi:tetratricopeptide (TPR) repeat protein